jgi:hypothetical protein
MACARRRQDGGDCLQRAYFGRLQFIYQDHHLSDRGVEVPFPISLRASFWRMIEALKWMGWEPLQACDLPR